jgi:hypothetical protein
MSDLLISSTLMWLYVLYIGAMLVAIFCTGRPDQPARPKGGVGRRSNPGDEPRPGSSDSHKED